MNVFESIGNSIKKTIDRTFFSNSPATAIFDWISGNRSWSKYQQLTQYRRYVYAIVSAIIEVVSKIEFEVYKYDKNKKAPQANHPFLQLMRKPNPEASQFQFLELHFLYMNLVAESYWYLIKREKSKKIEEMYILRPDLMKVKREDKFKYGKSAGEDNPRGLITEFEESTGKGKSEKFDPQEILFFKTAHPLTQDHGMSPIQAGQTYIETEGNTAEWTKNTIKNSGRPSGVLGVEGLSNEEQIKKIKKQFKENYSGVENAGKTLLLGGIKKLSYQKLGMELGEVALKELKDMNKDDVMFMYRASKVILGITDDVNRASAMEMKAVFYENIVKPQLDRFVDHLNAFLMTQIDPNATIEYKDPSFITTKEKVEEWTKGADVWLTRNEIRAARSPSLNPIKGGDSLYIPVQMVPIGTDANGPTQNAFKKLKKKV